MMILILSVTYKILRPTKLKIKTNLIRNAKWITIISYTSFESHKIEKSTNKIFLCLF